MLFSGPYRRPDGLAAFLTRFGFEPVLLDNDPETGGGADGDILSDDVHNRLLQRVSRGEFLAIVAAPPCSTFSVTRHFAADGSKDDGPPVVRDRKNIRGLPNVPAKHLRELRQANAVVARMTALLTAPHSQQARNTSSKIQLTVAIQRIHDASSKPTTAHFGKCPRYDHYSRCRPS